MVRKLILCILLIFPWLAHAQESGSTVGDYVKQAYASTSDFKGKFTVNVSSDSICNVFIVNLSLLPSRFEKVYFMNLSFTHPELVNIFVDFEQGVAVFSSNTKYQKQAMLDKLDGIRSEAVKLSGEWSQVKKSEWLSVNDKYK